MDQLSAKEQGTQWPQCAGYPGFEPGFEPGVEPEVELGVRARRLLPWKREEHKRVPPGDAPIKLRPWRFDFATS